MKEHLAGNQYCTDDDIISADVGFYYHEDESFFHSIQEIKTPMEEMHWPQGGGNLLKNKSHVVIYLVKLWIF